MGLVCACTTLHMAASKAMTAVAIAEHGNVTIFIRNCREKRDHVTDHVPIFCRKRLSGHFPQCSRQDEKLKDEKLIFSGKFTANSIEVNLSHNFRDE
jgi:hypothetical protein